MYFFAFVSALLLSVNQVSAAVCSGTTLPAWITVNQAYPIVTKSALSPSGTYNTTVSGSFIVDGLCTWSINGFSVANAPLSANIKVYGINSMGAFPLSQFVVNGTYTNVNLIDPTMLDAIIFQQGTAGVSWPQVNSIVLFSETDNWVIASVTFPGAPASSTAAFTAVPYTTATATSKLAATATSTPKSSVQGMSASIAFMVACVVAALL